MHRGGHDYCVPRLPFASRAAHALPPAFSIVHSFHAPSRDSDLAVSRQRRAPLKVLHAIAPGAFGGLERVVCTLLPALLELDIDTRVAAVLGADEQHHLVVEELRDAGVPVDTIQLRDRSYLLERH